MYIFLKQKCATFFCSAFKNVIFVSYSSVDVLEREKKFFCLFAFSWCLIDNEYIKIQIHCLKATFMGHRPWFLWHTDIFSWLVFTATCSTLHFYVCSTCMLYSGMGNINRRHFRNWIKVLIFCRSEFSWYGTFTWFYFSPHFSSFIS